MCFGCWEKGGSPKIPTPEVMRAAAAIAEVYAAPGGSVGGLLHIVVDDFNVNDESLAYCRQSIAAGGFVDELTGERFMSEPERLAAERRCVELLERLTPRERLSAIAFEGGYWSTDCVPATYRRSWPAAPPSNVYRDVFGLDAFGCGWCDALIALEDWIHNRRRCPNCGSLPKGNG